MSTSTPPTTAPTIVRDPSKLSLLILLSGSGTNFAALLTACTTPSSPLSGLAQITHVISNRKSAYGLVRASAAGIPSTYHNLVRYKAQQQPPDEAAARAAYDSDLARIILAQRPDVVVCAGWMHILSPSFLAPLADAGVDIINLHPALPGMFDGKDAIRRAWEAFQRGEVGETGVMVHRVVDEVDRGEPVVVRRVEMREGETLDDLEERIHKVEWEAIVDGTLKVVEERIQRVGRKGDESK